MGGDKERDRESLMRMSRERERSISSGKSVENKALFHTELSCGRSQRLIKEVLTLVGLCC